MRVTFMAFTKHITRFPSRNLARTHVSYLYLVDATFSFRPFLSPTFSFSFLSWRRARSRGKTAAGTAPSWRWHTAARLARYRVINSLGRSSRLTSHGCSRNCLALWFRPRLHFQSHARRNVVLAKCF